MKWRMSVSQEMAENSAHQMHNAPIERKTLELNFQGRNKDWRGTTADVEPSRGKLGVD